MNKTEVQILGSILYKPEVLFDCLRHKITENSFTEAKNIRLWQEITKLHAKSKSIDAVSLNQALTGTDTDSEWTRYMDDLVDGVFTVRYVTDHIENLKRSEQIRTAKLVMTDAMACTSEDMISKVIGELMRLQCDVDTSEHKIGDYRLGKVEQWREAKKHGFVGLPFCIREVNEYLGGWRNGCFALLGGYRGEGKSTLIRQDAYSQARAGRKVLLFSLEDPADIASAGIAALHAGISTFHLDTGQAYDETINKIDQKWQELSDLPLWIESSNMSITQIVGAAEAAYHKHGIDIIYGDHIQYISPLVMPNISRNDTLSHYSMTLAGMAKRLKIPVIWASQLSRASEKQNRKPRLSDFRDSGSLEQDARQALLLYWDNDAKHHKLEVAKNNYGISNKTIDIWRLDGKQMFSPIAPKYEKEQTAHAGSVERVV